MTKLSPIKAKVKNVFSMSTVHGVPNIIHSDKNVITIMWIVCLAISSVGCGFFIFRSISDYLKYEAVTQYDIIYQTSAEFPTISICSDPQFDSHFLTGIVHCYMNMDTTCRNKLNDYFHNYTDSQYGICYRFKQKNKTIKSTQSGYEFGFRLGLKIENPYKNKSRILIIHIHNYSTSSISLYNKGYHISSGKRYFFAVERTFVSLLDDPYNNCLKNPLEFTGNKTIIEYFKNKSIKYEQKHCLELCFELKFIENATCNCSQHLGGVIRECLKESNTTCIFNFRKDFYEEGNQIKCLDYCPLECDTVSYNIIPSNFDFPSNGTVFDHKLKNNFSDYEEVKHKYFDFYVYYNELKYISISESPKIQISDLVSNVGGTLGLFIGISFLSFIELLEVILQIILTLNDKKIYIRS